MRDTVALLLAVLLVGPVIAGCGGFAKTNGTTAATPVAAPKICGHCGQIKGTDACCAAGQERCAKCGLCKIK